MLTQAHIAETVELSENFNSVYCFSKFSHTLFVTGEQNGKVIMYSYNFYAENCSKHFELNIEWGTFMTDYASKIWAFKGIKIKSNYYIFVTWYDFLGKQLREPTFFPEQFPSNACPETFEYLWCESSVRGIILLDTTAISNGLSQSIILDINLDTLRVYSISSLSREYFDGYKWTSIVEKNHKLILLENILPNKSQLFVHFVELSDFFNTLQGNIGVAN